jgi:exopolysaccharide production protein ExoY
MGNIQASRLSRRVGFSPATSLSEFNPELNVVRPGVPRIITTGEAIAWRMFDLVAAILILCFMMPFLTLLALATFISDPGPIFYSHRRIGHRGRYFHCLKFRTMRVDGDTILEAHLRASPAARREWEATHKLRDDPRVTPLGGLMRKLSLDEFPQLLNVLSGEMSLVGPRPIVEQEVHKYGYYFEHYCRVRPGLTGIWQTSGRSDTSYHQRVTMDVAYVRRKSLGLDLWLLAKTLPAVLLAKGSY